MPTAVAHAPTPPPRVEHPAALDLGELIAVPIHTYRDHGATDGTYLMRVPAGVSGPVESHPFAERIYALEPLTVVVDSVDGEPISFAIDASAALTISPGTRHQVVAPSTRYPTAYIAILSPDCDHPSLDDAPDVEALECAACGLACDGSVAICRDGIGEGPFVPVCVGHSLASPRTVSYPTRGSLSRSTGQAPNARDPGQPTKERSRETRGSRLDDDDTQQRRGVPVPRRCAVRGGAVTPRRPILTALLIVASALAGLTLYAYLIATGRDEQRAEDDSEVLHAIAEGRPADLPPLRITEAWARLERDGLLVALAGALYLTRAGWARAGKPLSDGLLELLREARDDRTLRRRGYPTSIANLAWSYGLLMRGGWQIAPAGRAVLMAEREAPHA